MLIINLLILLIYSSVINNKDKYNIYLTRLGIIIIIYSLYLIIDLPLEVLYNNINNIHNIYIYNNLYNINIYNIYIIILIYIVIISLLSINLISNKINNIKLNKEFNININYINIVLFNLLGLILLLLSNNLISIFISIELQSYSLYILTGIISKSQVSGHNSLLYYLIGSLASILILYGISLLYYTTSNIYINNINILLNYDLFNDNIIIGWLFLIFGLLIKIGAAPMYNWSILLYSNSNTIITSYISIIPKLSILSYILYIINSINNNNINILNNYYYNKLLLLISIIIILSLLIGSINGIIQIKIKNILAYSGLLNIGYLLITILINNINSIVGYIIYLTQYSFNHISIFILLILSLFYNNKKNNQLIYIYELANIKYNIYLVISLIIIVGSFIGIPPLLGFYGKYYILISSINNNYLLISILLIISSIIATLYYLYFLNVTIINNNTIENNTKENYNNKIKNIELEIGYGNNIITYILSSYILITLLNFIQWNNILKGAYIISIYFNIW